MKLGESKIVLNEEPCPYCGFSYTLTVYTDAMKPFSLCRRKKCRKWWNMSEADSIRDTPKDKELMGLEYSEFED